jgi:threonine dehydrogenase-like Zn-dependent dehydrogenase
LGHEFSGIIENIEKNSKFKIGDKVVAQPLIFDKSNEITKSKSIGKDYNGGFSEYVLVPINNLIKLPSNISFDLATLTDVVAVCIHAKSLIDIQKNSKVLIIGDGAIGISMGMVLKTVCKKVYLKGKNQKNIGVASKIGIKTFDDKKKNLSSYDFIFETVGRKQDTTLSEAIKYISPKGKIVILGVYEKSYL